MASLNHMLQKPPIKISSQILKPRIEVNGSRYLWSGVCTTGQHSFPLNGTEVRWHVPPAPPYPQYTCNTHPPSSAHCVAPGEWSLCWALILMCTRTFNAVMMLIRCVVHKINSISSILILPS